MVKPKKAKNRPSAKSGIISEMHRGGRHGFIEPMDGGSPIFVHCSDIQGFAPKLMGTGTRVVYEERFDIYKGRTRAHRVRALCPTDDQEVPNVPS